MLTHHFQINSKEQAHNDHDLTELSWLTRSNIFDQRSSNSIRPLPKLSQSLPIYTQTKEEPSRHHYSSPPSLIDSSDSEHDNDSSSLNSSSERVTTTVNDSVSPPHSALCFWILFAIEESKTRSLTLNEICEWIERHIEQQQQQQQQKQFISTNPINSSSDEQSIRSARLKSKIRYHMTKQISFFVKIIKDPVSGIKLRYPLWTTDRSKRSLLLDTLLTMNTRQLSLYTQYTIGIYERLCVERRLTLARNTNDENSCPTLLNQNIKRDKTINRLGSCEDFNNNKKRKKHRSKNEPMTTTTTTTTTTTPSVLPVPLTTTGTTSTTATPSVEIVDAAMTLLLLRKTK